MLICIPTKVKSIYAGLLPLASNIPALNLFPPGQQAVAGSATLNWTSKLNLEKKVEKAKLYKDL